MSEPDVSRRGALVRESLLFQVKLVADGVRDFVLVPVSLVATVVGLLRSGENPELEFNRVLDLGRQSERWINLFGQHDPIDEAGHAGSIDRLVTRTEEILREQARRGDVSESASAALSGALETLHRSVRPAREVDVKGDSETDR